MLHALAIKAIRIAKAAKAIFFQCFLTKSKIFFGAFFQLTIGIGAPSSNATGKSLETGIKFFSVWSSSSFIGGIRGSCSFSVSSSFKFTIGSACFSIFGSCISTLIGSGSTIFSAVLISTFSVLLFSFSLFNLAITSSKFVS